MDAGVAQTSPERAVFGFKESNLSIPFVRLAACTSLENIKQHDMSRQRIIKRFIIYSKTESETLKQG